MAGLHHLTRRFLSIGSFSFGLVFGSVDYCGFTCLFKSVELPFWRFVMRAKVISLSFEQEHRRSEQNMIRCYIYLPKIIKRICLENQKRTVDKNETNHQKGGQRDKLVRVCFKKESNAL